MSHDKLKAIARQRMAVTGEPYSVARRAVIRQHRENLVSALVGAQLSRNAQEVRAWLAPTSGIDEINWRFALLAFRNLGHSLDDQPAEVTELDRQQLRCRRCGSSLQLDGFGHWHSPSGTGQCLHEGASW
jgi:hypothetical protein